MQGERPPSALPGALRRPMPEAAQDPRQLPPMAQLQPENHSRVGPGPGEVCKDCGAVLLRKACHGRVHQQSVVRILQQTAQEFKLETGGARRCLQRPHRAGFHPECILELLSPHMGRPPMGHGLIPVARAALAPDGQLVQYLPDLLHHAGVSPEEARLYSFVRQVHVDGVLPAIVLHPALVQERRLRPPAPQ